jgi:DinB family protein
MQTSRNELIRTLEKTHPTLVKLTRKLSEAALDFRPTPADWSTRDVLAHLVDDEMYVNRLRLERIVKEDMPHLTPHDEKKWYADRNTSRDRRSELLADFALQREASLMMLKMLRESDWARMGFQPEYGEFSAEGWLSYWVKHDLVHLKQIESNLEKFGKYKQ